MNPGGGAVAGRTGVLRVLGGGVRGGRPWRRAGRRPGEGFRIPAFSAGYIHALPRGSDTDRRRRGRCTTRPGLSAIDTPPVRPCRPVQSISDAERPMYDPDGRCTTLYGLGVGARCGYHACRIVALDPRRKAGREHPTRRPARPAAVPHRPTPALLREAAHFPALRTGRVSDRWRVRTCRRPDCLAGGPTSSIGHRRVAAGSGRNRGTPPGHRALTRGGGGCPILPVSPPVRTSAGS